MKLYFKYKPLVACAMLVVVISLSLATYAFKGEGALQIVFLDVGQGDAIFITTPNGRQVLVDAGPHNNLGQTLARYMPASDRSLDLVIMTHPDLDHIGGMVSLVDRYDIDLVMHSGLLAGSSTYKAVADRINQKKIPTIRAEAGQVIELDKDIFLEIYSPYQGFESLEPNDFSIVARLVYRDTSALLTGDATKLNEHEIVETYGDIIHSDILKVGHHGSQTSTSDVFVATVAPQYGIISAGCNNRFGHPHGDVLATLFTYHIEILDTCNSGDIVFESDGIHWSVNH